MNEYRITGLELNGVGVFDQLKLTFPEKDKKLKDKAEIHIFTGINGTGKTTLLQALTYFDVEYNIHYEDHRRRAQDSLYSKADYEFHMSNEGDISHGGSILLKIFFENKLEWRYYFVRHSNTIPILSDYYNYIPHLDLDGFPVQAPYAFLCYSGHRQIINSSIDLFKEINVNTLRDALDWSRNELGTNIFQWIANIKTKEALAFQKGDKRGSEEYSQNLKAVEIAFSEIIARKVEFVLDERLLQVRIKIDNISSSFAQLAEGYKSIICWLVDLFFRLESIHLKNNSPFTLFLDEIDIHLHPSAQRRILPVVQKLFPNAQIFVTTHSPFVLGSIDGAWIYKFKFDGNGHSILDGEPIESEDGLSYGYIVKEILGVEENFGIEVEALLKSFYIERDKIINNPDANSDFLVKLSKDLAIQSPQLQSIIGSELKQLSRITHKEFSL